MVVALFLQAMRRARKPYLGVNLVSLIPRRGYYIFFDEVDVQREQNHLNAYKGWTVNCSERVG